MDVSGGVLANLMDAGNQCGMKKSAFSFPAGERKVMNYSAATILRIPARLFS
jgi:hypothetical protein